MCAEELITFNLICGIRSLQQFWAADEQLHNEKKTANWIYFFNSATKIFLILITSFISQTLHRSPLDIVVLCDESQSMFYYDSQRYFGNFAFRFLETNFKKEDDSQPETHYAAVACGNLTILGSFTANAPTTLTSVEHCTLKEENYLSKNYESCFRTAQEKLMVPSAGDRPDVHDVVMIFGDGEVDINDNTSMVAAALRSRADIFYFYIPNIIMKYDEAIFNSKYLPKLSNITGDQSKVILFDTRNYGNVAMKFFEGLCYKPNSTTKCYINNSIPIWKCNKNVTRHLRQPKGMIECPKEPTLITYERCIEDDCSCDKLYKWNIVQECDATECGSVGQAVYIRELPQFSMCTKDIKYQECAAPECQFNQLKTPNQLVTATPIAKTQIFKYIFIVFGSLLVLTIAIVVTVLCIIRHKKRIQERNLKKMFKSLSGKSQESLSATEPKTMSTAKSSPKKTETTIEGKSASWVSTSKPKTPKSTAISKSASNVEDRSESAAKLMDIHKANPMKVTSTSNSANESKSGRIEKMDNIPSLDKKMNQSTSIRNEDSDVKRVW